MKVRIGKLKLKNPVLVASGTFGYAEEFQPYLNLRRLGGIITKTITPEPRKGNPPPRVIESSSGMLNSIGLQNEGLRNFLKEKMPYLRRLGVPIIVSIGADSIDGYVYMAQALGKAKGVSALELNISCPNVKGGEFLFAQDKESTYELVKKVRSVTGMVLITKLSPNVTDIVAIAQSAQDAGSDAVSLVNTFFGMAVDVNSRKPKLGNVFGGLSGPAIKPIALYMVWKVSQSLDIPVIGMGGIMCVDDALEFMVAGATAVCVGTGNLVDPDLSENILRGIKDYLKINKIENIHKLIGSLNP